MWSQNCLPAQASLLIDRESGVQSNTQETTLTRGVYGYHKKWLGQKHAILYDAQSAHLFTAEFLILL